MLRRLVFHNHSHIDTIEPESEVFKIGKESNFTRGIYKGTIADQKSPFTTE